MAVGLLTSDQTAFNNLTREEKDFLIFDRQFQNPDTVIEGNFDDSGEE